MAELYKRGYRPAPALSNQAAHHDAKRGEEVAHISSSNEKANSLLQYSAAELLKLRHHVPAPLQPPERGHDIPPGIAFQPRRRLTIPTLDPILAESLDRCFTAEELKKAVMSMQSQKSPGGDGVL
uniref:Uncharacterized protein n=1 Tax=Knipowitschia caucasica TaxID=637954 RepID=A0AAV2LB75_KNICA